MFSRILVFLCLAGRFLLLYVALRSLFLAFCRFWSRRAEQNIAKRSKAEQNRAKQSSAEQSRTEQSRAKQSNAEQRRAEQNRAKQSKADCFSPNRRSLKGVLTKGLSRYLPLPRLRYYPM